MCFSSRNGLEWIDEWQTAARGRARFEVFVTTDRNLLFQQNLAKFNLAIIVLEAHSTRLSDTLPLMSEVLVALKTIQAKEAVWIALSGEL